MKKIFQFMIFIISLLFLTSCNMNQSNEIGRYSFQRINPSDLSTFLVFDNKEGIIYIGAYTKEGFYLNSRNAITGEEKIIAKPEIKSN